MNKAKNSRRLVILILFHRKLTQKEGAAYPPPPPKFARHGLNLRTLRKHPANIFHARLPIRRHADPPSQRCVYFLKQPHIAFCSHLRYDHFQQSQSYNNFYNIVREVFVSKRYYDTSKRYGWNTCRECGDKMIGIRSENAREKCEECGGRSGLDSRAQLEERKLAPGRPTYIRRNKPLVKKK